MDAGSSHPAHLNRLETPVSSGGDEPDMAIVRPQVAVVSLLCAALGLGACKKAPCDDAPTALTLHIRAGSLLGVKSFVVRLTAGAAKWQRTYEAGDSLLDGDTSLFVRIEPVPVAAFAVHVEVDGFDGAALSGALVARGMQDFAAQPNACNEFDVHLRQVPGEDAGPSDGDVAVDATPTDASATDADPDGGVDAATPDADSGTSPRSIVITLAAADFDVDGTSTLAVEIRDILGNRVTDSIDVLAFDPTGHGTIKAVKKGTGDNRYGQIGATEFVTVENGQAVVQLTALVPTTFDVIVSGSSMTSSVTDTIAVRPSPVLLAWYRLNETQGTVITDSSGHGTHGTIVGNLQSDSNAISDGRSLRLSASDYVAISGLFGQPSSLTMMAFVSLSNAGAVGAEVVSLGDRVLMRLDAADPGALAGFVGSYAIGPTVWRGAAIGAKVAGTSWHHLAYAVDAANDVQKLYLDGELVSVSRHTASIAYGGRGSTTYLGHHGTGQAGYEFTGLIDEVRLYARPLSEIEIASVYDQYMGAVGHWDFADQTARDRIPHRHDGSLLGNATTVSGPMGYALSLDGDGDGVEVSGLVALNAISITLSAWAKLDRRDQAGARLIDFRGAANITLDWPIDNNGTSGIFRSAQARQHPTPSQAYHAGTGWHHFAYAIGASSSTQRLYVDGQLINTTNATHAVSFAQASTSVFIGRGNGLDDASDFKGLIDDVRIFNRAITAHEARRLVARPFGLMGFWRFDSGLGTQASDSSGLAADGVVSGATWTTAGAPNLNGAVRFQNATDSITLGTYGFDEISIAGWFNKSANNASGADAIVSHWYRVVPNDPSREEGFEVRFSASDHDRLEFLVLTQNRSGIRMRRQIETVLSPSTGAWHHFAATYKLSTGDQDLYVDGVHKSHAEHPDGNVIVPLVTHKNMLIGKSYNDGGAFQGTIDDVRIYNRPLSAAEVQDLAQGTSVP